MYLGDFFSFFDLRPRLKSPPDGKPFPDRVKSEFLFDQVSFRYPGSNRWALRNLDLQIRTGEIVALVGENGSGKSTVVKLLSRLYDPTEGRITLDGYDLREYELGALRNAISTVLQDFGRFEFTAGENIGIGRISEIHNPARVRKAASLSLADRVISRLPAGYNQMLGKRFSGGRELSGGEWQRIALARAYMGDAAVVILDEPTSALDAQSEAETFQNFRNLIGNKCAVLISHRFSTVRIADRIIVLENGTVVEQGSHDDLVEIGGRYAMLFNLQASGYR